MAGIGFHLQKLFKEDHLSSHMQAYSFTAMVTAGPWLIVIAALLLIQSIIAQFGDPSFNGLNIITASISYCFIFSQLLFGSFQLIATRYAADRLYAKDVNSLFPTMAGLILLLSAISTAIWIVFALLSPMPIVYKWLLLMLFLALNIIWSQTIFLTAAKNYTAITKAFGAGAFVAVACTWIVSVLPIQTSTAFLFEGWVIASFTFGMIVTAVWLSTILLQMFPEKSTDGMFSFLTYIDKFPRLFWAGFFYNAGLWVCNVLIWFGEGSLVIADTFRMNPQYDTAIFWSYLTIVPTYMFFVVSIETRFYTKYKRFYNYINNGGTLDQINQSKEDMQKALRDEIERLMRNQGVVTFLIIVGVLFYSFNFGQDQNAYTILQLGIIGAFANAMLLINMLLMLYFEDQSGAAKAAAVFFTLNLLLTAILLPFGERAYGISFALGSILAFMYSLQRLFAYVKKIDYHVFAPALQHGKPAFFTSLAEKLNKNKKISRTT
ncbi:exopolysaccharide Pel transporter PelG [Domibacillus iocasae]|uniref:Polysaccharide biosynthesis protein C-terminal domain-containing protein n=1 Tax=Domibacillus iocasae TaxID=1714016 RepID=A0A1E7DNA6_9BACI|nr:exopolysaccharide Pel transporter PelG [Domibacillus iocasae]OES44567.1 hypothetical protein BA724_09860 [Domibacillus iocasae]